jgi:hypothetical protein
MNHDTDAARAAGYADAMNGLCLPDFYPCQCFDCREAYDQGQKDAIYEMGARR